MLFRESQGSREYQSENMRLSVLFCADFERGSFFEGALFPFAILKNANFFQKNRKKIMRIFYTIEMQV